MKPSKRGCVILVLAAALSMGACAQRVDNANAAGGAAPSTASEDEVVKLNSGPQKEYPELTVEAQKEAMRLLEEDRRRTRVEGLREKTPPADWIAMPYHGLVLDANFDVIEMTPETVAKMQESMFSILYDSTREKANQRFGGDLRTLFDDQRFQGDERLLMRSATLEALLSESDEKLRQRYEWRQRLIRRGLAGRADARDSLLRDLSDFKSRGFSDDWFRPRAPDSAYVQNCRAQGVPIPPDWPDPRWVSQGTLAFVFISEGRDAEVFAYKDPSVPGACYALPRRTGSSIDLLGIICESDATGKACFWDNRTVNDEIIIGPDVHLVINDIGNGSTLGENCTECHRGDNFFNIHPGTALQLERAGAPGGPYDTTPAVRYAPIGQAHWSNPATLSLSPPPAG